MSFEDLSKFELPSEILDICQNAPSLVLANTVEELIELSCPHGQENQEGFFEVAYDIPNIGHVLEATVCRVRNGISVNYPEPYMRKRDPDCMVIADDKPTDKPRFEDVYGVNFSETRTRTFEWLKTQDLLVYFFNPGGIEGLNSIILMPKNCGHFGFALALLQGMIDTRNLPDGIKPKAAVFVAPPFRHTDFNGKQIVVHSRLDEMYEMFSFNLYPGPSAKKGVYGMLIDLGEKEGWVANHCSCVQVITPYDNQMTISHEGASGGGKSEMLEYIHRESEGRIKLGENLVTNEERFLVLAQGCRLRPVIDDMSICPPSIQRNHGKITIFDAEQAWFVRVDHIQKYGTDPHLEALTINTPVPILFLNVDAAPGSTALIWEHTMDTPTKRCSNPRVILPRKIAPDVINVPVSVDIRSFGVRCPPCTSANPTYGIVGLFHVLPPALAWLWRIVAPRGYANPSIVETEGLQSEGVGSYWPFAPGRRVPQANLLLRQVLAGYNTRYILCSNQHVGAWKVGFMPEWIAREYFARRGHAKFSSNVIEPARCPILGYAMKSINMEGQSIANVFLRVETQPEVGIEGYDAGAKILLDFFKTEAAQYLEPDLDPLGRKIIEILLNDGTLKEYEDCIESELIDNEN